MMNEKFENQEQLMDLSVEYNKILPGANSFEAYRMNLMDISVRLKQLFLALNEHIQYYNLNDDLQPVQKQPTENKLFVVSYQKINQIKVQGDSNRQLLFSVDMGANVAIYNVSQILMAPIILINTYQGIQDCSTWSLDIFIKDGKDHRAVGSLLAVGSNSRNISLWDISKVGFIDTQVCQAQLIRETIQGMNHNIPCVQFSPCGKFLAAGSIDQTVQIFHVQSQQAILVCQLPEWGWGILWIKQKNICDYSEFYYQKKIKRINEIELQEDSKEREDQNSIQNDISQYLLFVTTNLKTLLIDTTNEYVRQNKEYITLDQKDPQKMEIIHQIDYDVSYLPYSGMYRFSILYFLKKLNIVYLPPQHSPIIFFIKINFSQDNLKFYLEGIQMENENNQIINNKLYFSANYFEPLEAKQKNLKQNGKIFLFCHDGSLIVAGLALKSKTKKQLEDEEDILLNPITTSYQNLFI